MRVLVTGATGMLGREVARALAHRGDGVTVLQRRPAGLGLSEVLTDISNAEAVRTAASDQDAVIHLAAKVNVIGPEAEYERVNVRGTRAVVDAHRRRHGPATSRRLIPTSAWLDAARDPPELLCY